MAITMNDLFSNAQQIRKPAIVSKGGIVAAQSRKAAEIGAAVLAAGGDCVDAVIATTFALGVLEPWMSGLGGGGAMVLYRAREDRYEVIDYGMRAPSGLRLEDYPLTGDGAASDLFPWARVKDDRNLHGPGSVAVPGVVAGMEEAHRRHARLPWRELLAPERRARRRRPRGRLVDHADDRELGRRSAALSRERRRLSRRTACRRARNGASRPTCGCRRTGSRRRCPISRRKARAISTRAIWRAASPPTCRPAAARCRSRTSPPSAPIGASRWRSPIAAAQVFATPELTCGPTLAHTLRLLQQHLQPGRGGPDAAAYAAYALALQSAYRERLQDMGDADGRRALGAEHLAPACTTHFSVVDRDGNMAAVTQTLLSTFGSKFVTPQSGITMNNGIMWFDPTPGGAQFAGARQALPDQLHAGAGAGRRRPAARGRRLRRPAHPAGGDAASVVRDGLRHGPRRGDPPAAHRCQRRRDRDRRRAAADADAAKRLRARFDYEEARVQTLPMKFACPSVVLRDGATNSGATEIVQPWGDAVAEG